MRFYRPAEGSKELQYLRERRAALGGSVPARRSVSAAIPVPAPSPIAKFAIEGRRQRDVDHDGAGPDLQRAVAR
jgi:pyruvate dehydrogenase complex dehydrogenase (E1) component